MVLEKGPVSRLQLYGNSRDKAYRLSVEREAVGSFVSLEDEYEEMVVSLVWDND